jgi:hypothetical protein
MVLVAAEYILVAWAYDGGSYNMVDNAYSIQVQYMRAYMVDRVYRYNIGELT